MMSGLPSIIDFLTRFPGTCPPLVGDFELFVDTTDFFMVVLNSDALRMAYLFILIIFDFLVV